MREVRFDDLDGLRALVSEELGPFGQPVAVTQEMVDGFARITGDDQWIHTDVERARREGGFGGTIAHGFLLLSLMSAMRDRSGLRIVGAGAVLNYGGDRLRFVSPVRVGSEVHLRQRLVGVEEKGRGTLVRAERELRAVDAERPAVLYQGLALYVPA